MTPSPVLSATVTLTAAPSAVLSATPSPALSSSAPGLVEGPLLIEAHQAWPQPMTLRGGYVSVKLQGPADRLRLKLYTPAMVLVAEVDGPGRGPGWGRLTLGPALWQGMAPGLYFYTVAAELGSVHSAPVAPGRILLVR